MLNPKILLSLKALAALAIVLNNKDKRAGITSENQKQQKFYEKA